ncbi:glycoside hydrolase family 140 protein [Flavihumibacter fluvii]|uniref:glycoside hydrolase family 140 protein n=1 Tax=Flavihumibacter fluvii TaxID=2838157 RepID=UPI001BDEA63C|nr:glycoside hydrolase family 140 protein [Flavihumibacter fluvii]ULQ52439.1 glycoside hydrolase family 140 protein [Flavihumibacter fluvii]
MKIILFGFLVMLVSPASYAQFEVSSNHRFILKDGKPFFYLADTGWELFHRLDRDQAAYYLKRRSEQGFTVVQAVVLAEFDGLHVANPYGDLPLLNDNPATPNENYFRHVDYIINKAAEYNMVIALLPTWGDKVWKGGWGKGPVIFNALNAKAYGKWIAERYKSKTNIIWVVGGDRNPQDEEQVKVWRSLATGIQEGIGVFGKPMISFHPQPNEKGSAEWFHQDDWLSFNMFQNGHCRNTPVYDKIQRVYNMLPTKPVMDAEPIYEDHPVCFNAHDMGTSNAYDTRLYAYLDVFSGAHGHTYGCHDIWQFYSPYREAVNGPHIYWQEAMELPGANQMVFLRKLMESRPFLDRVPDQSLVVENDEVAAERIQATRGKDYVFIYTAAGKPFTVNLGKITGAKLNAAWYNPRNGETVKLDSINNKGKQKFSPPAMGYGQDWVLILDDDAKNYALPK